MAGSPAEREMRAVVAQHMRALMPAARIIHELPVGGCRADLAAVDPSRIVLAELKSCRDTLTRAKRQMESFVDCAHEAVLVADICFFDRTPYDNGAARCAATEELQSYGGQLWVYPKPPENADLGNGGLYGWRLNRRAMRQPRAAYLLSLLLRDELIAEAVRHNIKVKRRMTVLEIADAMVWAMTGQQIAESSCRQLRLRRFPEADPIISEMAA